MPPLLLADLSLFFGRFHPLVVHLPIGFLLLAALLEWWPGEKLRPALRLMWWLGAASAVVAAALGWQLAAESGGGDTLFWHRWLGVGVAVVAIGGAWLARRGGPPARWAGVLTAGLLAVTGHLGGNLTHGSAYLVEHAPAPVRQLLAADLADDEPWHDGPVDSLRLYADLLKPLLADNCERCHNADKQNGGLRMDRAALLFAGGDTGAAISPGQADASLLYRRVTLPRRNRKAMPPGGEPLDFTAVRLLEYWIDSGADTLARLMTDELPDDVRALVERDYGLDLSPRLFVQKITAPALRAQTLEQLRQLGWQLSPAAPENGALDVKPAPGRPLANDALQQLTDLAGPQTAYLNLTGLTLAEADLGQLKKFPNLNRLNLSRCRLPPGGLSVLQELPYLESVNLHGTAAGDEVFPTLSALPRLERLYLWQTAVTPPAVAAFAAQRPGVSIDTGFVFRPVSSASSK